MEMTYPGLDRGSLWVCAAFKCSWAAVPSRLTPGSFGQSPWQSFASLRPNLCNLASLSCLSSLLFPKGKNPQLEYVCAYTHTHVCVCVCIYIYIYICYPFVAIIWSFWSRFYIFGDLAPSLPCHQEKQPDTTCQVTENPQQAGYSLIGENSKSQKWNYGPA